jgi:hypothetical protein
MLVVVVDERDLRTAAFAWRIVNLTSLLDLLTPAIALSTTSCPLLYYFS